MGYLFDQNLAVRQTTSACSSASEKSVLLETGRADAYNISDDTSYVSFLMEAPKDLTLRPR